MKILSNIKKLMLAVGVIICLTTLFASAQSESKIAFLHMKIDGQSVTLVDQQIVSGKLKEKRGLQPVKEMLWEVTDKSGTILASESLANPLVKRYEYDDPDNPGLLKMKIVTLDETEFTIRVPVSATATQISFYKRLPSVSKAKGEERELISSMALNFGSGKNDE